METKTMTAVDAHALIEREAKTKSRQEVRDVRNTLKPGKAVRQGDVYLVRLDDHAATGAQMSTRQLVDGTTQGSRHVVEGADVVLFVATGKKLPKCVREGALLGPAIVAMQDFVVTHPEHAHVKCGPGTYQTIHQLDASTMRRVQD